MSIWNSLLLPDSVVTSSSPSINAFEIRLDKHWATRRELFSEVRLHLISTVAHSFPLALIIGLIIMASAFLS
ncbi:hypothetical protein HAZT_HAZT007550 [Hyalella azteca]|uniref:Uncharacterized protein n=1 Tax=Hyalella azteca TaxID=294128 RepID=A0A6A0HE02_HYAAZ|nr:hypothetical protein HAZT_HAZT007550 [Hyalella azteca]